MYRDLEAKLHDLFWLAETDANETPLLRHFLKSHPGKALEVGCGSGRLLLELYKLGHDIDGIDISSDMLEILRSNLNPSTTTPNLYLGDASNYVFPRRYDAITIPAFTLQLLSRENALVMLKNLRQHATPNAALYLTTFIPWAEITDELECDIWHLDKETAIDNNIARCKTRHAINRIEQTLDRDHHYTIATPSGKTLQQQNVSQHLQWYLLPELTSMLKQCGWIPRELHCDLQLHHTDSDANILTLTATADTPYST